MSTKTEKKPAGANAAIIPSEKVQLAKKAEGVCLVKGCNNKAAVGPFYPSCAGKRAMMKRQGKPMDPIMDFAALEKAEKAEAKAKALKEKEKAAATQAKEEKAATKKSRAKPAAVVVPIEDVL